MFFLSLFGAKKSSIPPLSLHQYSAPSFQTNLQTEIDPFENITNIYTSFNQASLNSSRYYYSTLQFSKCKFENNSCLGSTLESGYGGALFVLRCEAVADNTEFTLNNAVFGGAIFAYQSSLYLKGCTFKENEAFKLGGAIGLEDSINNPGANSRRTIIDSCKFESNTAYECGGAAHITTIPDTEFKNCEFISNSASISGGAIYVTDIGTMPLADCKFKNNAIDLFKKFSQRDKKFTKNSAPSFSGRGGGAIYVHSKSKMITIKTCFINDSAAENSFGFSHGAGNEVMIGENVEWISYDDRTYAYPDIHDTFSIVGPNSTFTPFGLSFPTGTECEGSTAYNNVTENSDFTRTSPVVNIESSPSSIPLPTTFTYAATPITKAFSITQITPAKRLPEEKKLSSITTPPSPSRSPFPPRTDSPAPTRSIPPNNVKFSISREPTQVPSHTIVNTSTKLIVITESGNSGHKTYVEVDTYTLVESTVFVNGYKEEIILLDDGKPNSNNGKNKNMLFIIIGAVAAAIVIVVIIIVIIVMMKKREDATESSIEMAQETVEGGNTTSATVTVDNPLWTTSIAGDEEDPFKNDFQENEVEGFFNVDDKGLE